MGIFHCPAHMQSADVVRQDPSNWSSILANDNSLRQALHYPSSSVGINMENSDRKLAELPC